MRFLVLNFTKGLKKQVFTIISFLVCLFLACSVLVGFMFNIHYEQAQQQKIIGPYLNSMMNDPVADGDPTQLTSMINHNILPKAAYHKTINTNLRNWTVHLQNNLASQRLNLFDPHQPKSPQLGKYFWNNLNQAVAFNFQNPHITNKKDPYYINYNRLLASEKILPNLHLILSNPGQIAKAWENIDSNIKAQWAMMSHSALPLSDAPSNITTAFCTKIEHISLLLLWNAVVYSQTNSYTNASYYGYLDIVNSYHYSFFPSINNNYHYYSNPIITDGSNQPLQNNEVLVTPNYAQKFNKHIGDEITIFKKQYKIVGYAINAVYSNNFSIYGRDNHFGYFLNQHEYSLLNNRARLLPGYTRNNNTYFNANNFAHLNPNLNSANDSLYSQKLLQLFSRTMKSNLSQFYYHTPEPNNLSENMGIFWAYGLANNRDPVFLNIIIIADAFLFAGALLISFVVIRHLLRENLVSIGILKANGLSGHKPFYALVLLFTILTLFAGAGSLGIGCGLGALFNTTFKPLIALLPLGLPLTTIWIFFALFFPFILIVPAVSVYIYFQMRKSALNLIAFKQVIKKQKHPGKWLIRITKIIPLSSKAKLSVLFASQAKGKIFISFVVTICATVLLYLSFWTIHSINLASKNINESFLSQNINFYQNQTINKDKSKYNYDTIDGAHFNPTKTKQSLWDASTQSYQNVYKINLLNTITRNSLRNCWTPAKPIANAFKQIIDKYPIFIPYENVIKNLAKHNGIITFGFNLYNSQQTYLANTYSSKLSTLRDNNPNNINDKQNATYDYRQNFLNKQQVVYNQQMTLYGYQNNENSQTSTNFLNWKPQTVNLANFLNTKTTYQSMAQTADLTADPLAVQNALQNIYETFIPLWEKKYGYKSENIHVIPLMLNRVYAASKRAKIGDVLFSKNTNQNSLNVYVVYDFTNGLNQTSALIPSAAMRSYLYRNHQKNHAFNTQINRHLSADYNHFLNLINKTSDYKLTDLINNYRDYSVSLLSYTNKQQILKGFNEETSGLFDVLIAIAVVATVASFMQILVTMEIVFRTNLQIISLLKAFGYNKRWIFFRIFLIYFIFILLGGLLSLFLAWLTSYFIYTKLIATTGIFTPFMIQYNYIIYLTLVVLCLFAFSLYVIDIFNSHRHPVALLLK